MAPQQQKYAVITGASSGIGYSLAKKLAQKGYKVFGLAPASVLGQMQDLVDNHGVIPFACDITLSSDIAKAVELVREHTGGRVDILYNNAGIAIGGPALELDIKLVSKLFNVNVLGHMDVTTQFSKFVIAAKGTIVFTGSVSARVPLSWVSTYSATKAAIEAYAWTLRTELKPFGVRVHTIITGGVDTAIGDSEAGMESLQDSIYYVDGIEASVRATSRMSRDSKFSPDKYADQVVRTITSRRYAGFNLYRGYMAYTLHLLGRYAPIWLTEFIITSYFKQRTVLKNAQKSVAIKLQGKQD